MDTVARQQSDLPSTKDEKIIVDDGAEAPFSTQRNQYLMHAVIEIFSTVASAKDIHFSP
jgi:hypothetical protein